MQLDEFMARLPKGDFWVFGYGSLMWSPCFSYQARVPGRAHGYHRALCILSTRYRGTLHRPGLVMGLCRGGSCWGVAFRIERSKLRRALARLWAREMPRRVYHPRLVAVRLRSGRTVRALAFVADPTHSRTSTSSTCTDAPGSSRRGSACAGPASTTSRTRSTTCTRSACATRISSECCTPRRSYAAAIAARIRARASRKRARCVPKFSRTKRASPNCAPGDNATPCSRKSAQGSALFSPEQSIQAR
jgi:cation transport protein ChaC